MRSFCLRLCLVTCKITTPHRKRSAVTKITWTPGTPLVPSFLGAIIVMGYPLSRLLVNHGFFLMFCELENHHAFFMGKSTISTGPFSIAMLAYQRVSIFVSTMFGMIPSGCQSSFQSGSLLSFSNTPTITYHIVDLLLIIYLVISQFTTDC